MDEMFYGQWTGEVGVDGIGGKYAGCKLSIVKLGDGWMEVHSTISSFEQFEIFCNKSFK